MASRPAVVRGAILCPVDFSDDSRAALRYAVALAAGSACRVVVLFVADPLLVAAARTRYGDASIAGTSLAELRRFGAAVIPAAARVGIEVDYQVATGDPAAEIRAVTARVPCDLVVMGTHGLGGFNKLILGSTTERVLRETTVPVLAVPPVRGEDGRRLRARSTSWPGGRLLVPVALGRHAAGDVRAARSVARWFGASIILLHVLPTFQAPPWFARGGSIDSRQSIAAARRALTDLAAHATAGIRTERRLVTGQLAEEIAAQAMRERAGLIVMAFGRTSGTLGPRVGATVYHVLQHSPIPVLALPARRRHERATSLAATRHIARGCAPAASRCPSS